MTLNDAIEAIKKSDAHLSAETRNALHGATEGHPWCEGKSEQERALEVLCAIAGKPFVPGDAIRTIEHRAKGN